MINMMCKRATPNNELKLKRIFIFIRHTKLTLGEHKQFK